MFIIFFVAAFAAPQQLVVPPTLTPEPARGDGTSVLLGGHTYCYANPDRALGTELSCVTSGAPPMVKDIFPGRASGFPYALIGNGDRFLFLANDGVHGYEPWVSDGTSDGTHLLADLWPGDTDSGSTIYASGDGWLISGRSSLGACRLWRTDGQTIMAVSGFTSGLPPKLIAMTPSGSALFRDGNDFVWVGASAATVIATNTDNGNSYGSALGEAVYFFQHMGTAYTLYRATTDGLTAVTGAPQPALGFDMVSAGSHLFFVGSDRVTGNEVWHVEDTTAQLVADLIPGNNDLAPHLTRLGEGLGDSVAITVPTDMWRSDAVTTTHVASGTILQTGFLLATPGSHWQLISNYTSTGPQAWIWDLDDNSLVPLGTTVQQALCQNASGVFFLDTNSAIDFFDGTATHTAIGTAAPSIGPAICGDTLWLLTGQGGQTLLTSDATQVTTVATSSGVYRGVGGMLVPGAGDRFFALDWTGESQVYREHGTVTAENAINEQARGVYAGRVYFSSGTHGDGLAYDDATGVHQVTTNASANVTYPFATAVGVFYSAPSLTFIDDTSTVTTNDVSSARFATALGELAVVVSDDAITNSSGQQLMAIAPTRWAAGAHTLWVQGTVGANNVLVTSDGTVAGTRTVLGFTVAASEMALAGERLVIIGADGVLYGTDGITVTTLGGPSGPSMLTSTGASVFFAASDDTHGRELWRSDGLSAEAAADINPGSAASTPFALTALGTRLLFAADDGVHGTELWSSDGTTTTLVADINPGSGDGVPYAGAFAVSAGHAAFAGNDGQTGSEPWITDGTLAGTQLIADLEPGSEGSEPSGFSFVADHLYFTAARHDEATTMYSVALGADATTPPATTPPATTPPPTQPPATATKSASTHRGCGCRSSDPLASAWLAVLVVSVWRRRKNFVQSTAT